MFTSSPRTPSGLSLPPRGFAALAPNHAIVPPTSSLAARRRRPARKAVAAAIGTVTNVPACITARTGIRIASLAPLAVLKMRSS
jgi:hypothetical protein